MKILVISQYFTPDITAAAFRIGETYELLKKSGHEVKVITTYPHKSDVKLNENEQDIYRVKITELGKDGGLINYVLHYLSFIPGCIRNAFKIRFNGWKPDVIWVSSPPLFTGINGWLIKMLMRVPFVFDIRDIWPDTAVAAGQISHSGKVYKLGRFLELFLYKRANHLTCVSEPMARYLKEQVPGKPCTVIYNSISEDSIGTLDTPIKKTEQDTRILIYAGNLGYLQGLDVLIESFKEAVSQYQNASKWEVHLYGGGVEEDKLKDIVREYNLDNQVIFYGVAPKLEVQKKLQKADILFFSLKSHPVLEKTIPSKLFDYMMAGKPIIGGIDGEGKAILESITGNLTFQSDNVDDLTQQLIYAFSRIEDLEKNAHKNLTLVREKFTREKMTDKLEQVFLEIKRRK